MEKKYSEKLKNNLVLIKRRIKATILAGTAMLSLGACGVSDSQTTQVKEETSITTEYKTEPKTNVQTTTKVRPTLNTTTKAVEDPTEEKDDKVITNRFADDKEKETTTVTIAPTTTVKVEQKTQPTQVQIKNEEQAPKYKAGVTENQQPVEQQPVQQPVEQQPQTEPEVQQPTLDKVRRSEYSKYDLLDENEYQAMNAMNYLCNSFRKELYNGYFFETPYGASHGEYEVRALILNLNNDYGINVGLSGKAYDYTDEESYLIYSDALNLAHTQYFYESTVDFNKYLFDEDLANFLNTVSAEYKEYMNGNTEPLENELSNYFENNSVDIDNYAKYFFMRCTQNPYDLNAPEVEEARQMFFDNVAIPTFHKVKDNAIKVITR